jgi:ATP-binding cassette, subfamily C, bacterial
VLYDGRAVSDIPRPVWAASVGYVSQDVTLFEGSVRDNFTLWDETIPIEDVRQAAKDAEIDEVISTRPGGYDGPVAEDGANFSGGQRQRIEIGRALVRNPRILVLDEAASALDSETEMRVDRNLRRRGCTCLIIAHRLSTLKDADEILMLEQGKVVERGTHEELVRHNGRYAQLIKMS